MRVLTALLILTLIAACGRGSDRPSRAAQSISASGVINSACLSANRPAASRARCGCVQAVADQTLSGADQRRGATFFADPFEGHAVKLSDTTRDDAFWERWSNFAEQATAQCRET